MRTLLLTALLCAPRRTPFRLTLPPEFTSALRRAPAAHSQGGPPSGRPLSMQEFASKVPELLQDVQLPANMPPQRIFQQLDVNKNRLLDAKEQQTLRADVQKILASNANRKAGGGAASNPKDGAADRAAQREAAIARAKAAKGALRPSPHPRSPPSPGACLA